MSASMLDFESLELDFDPANLPRGEDLPYSDGEPLDSYWHREAMNVLIHSLEYHWRGRTDYFAGGDMFIHFSPTFLMNRDFRGPDVFVVLGTTLEPPRKSWVVWEEGWKYPNVVVELMSESTKRVDLGPKKALYERTWKTGEYFCYDPEGHRIQAWRLIDGAYVPIEPSDGRYWSEQLQVSLGTAKTIRINNYELILPRWFDESGQVVPLEREADARELKSIRTIAENERQKAEAEHLRAEAERQKAEAERQRADALADEVAKLKALLSQQSTN